VTTVEYVPDDCEWAIVPCAPEVWKGGGADSARSGVLQTDDKSLAEIFVAARRPTAYNLRRSRETRNYLPERFALTLMR